MTTANKSQLLAEQAFALVQAAEGEASNDAKAKIKEFSQLSVEHEAALKKAQLEWALLGQMTIAPLDTKQKAKLFIERQCVSLRDQPYRLIPVAAILLIAVMLLPLFISSNEVQNQTLKTPTIADIETKKFKTAYGQQKEVKLSDGSTVFLNWNTVIETRFSESQRQLTLLKGEALFDVAKDTKRPFIVAAGNSLTRAVGTQFNIRKLNDSDSHVAVSEGIVEVRLSQLQSDKRTLTVNQGITVSNNALGELESFDAKLLSSWREGILVFENKPLSQVLEELDRYSAYSIDDRFSDNEDPLVSATYFIDQIDNALSSLAFSFDLKLKTERKGQHTLIAVEAAAPQRPN
ncbi:MAG: FecR domain-containing protein [Cellvibrionaceae bacterium]|nr:FecR domain-containing protein [Cellvibrionaceae bacterium]